MVISVIILKFFKLVHAIKSRLNVIAVMTINHYSMAFQSFCIERKVWDSTHAVPPTFLQNPQCSNISIL